MKEYKETHHSLMYKSNSDLSLYSAGYEECASGYSYGPKIRSYHLIHFVLYGKGELHINEHIFQLSAGDAFLIPAGKVSYYEASKADPWCYAWISFLGINSQMYLYQLMTSSDDVYIIHGLDTVKYKERIFDIIALQGASTSSYFQANGVLFQIMAMLFDDIGFQESNWGKTLSLMKSSIILTSTMPKNKATGYGKILRDTSQLSHQNFPRNVWDFSKTIHHGFKIKKSPKTFNNYRIIRICHCQLFRL